MTRRSFPLVLIAFGLVAAPASRAQSPDEFAQTAAYVATLQNPDGGFALAPGQPSGLVATSAAVRIMRYVGGSVPDVSGCIKYVRSCRVEGGYAPEPGGRPDPVTTAFGLVAASELKAADQETVDAAVAFFHDHAKEFNEVRMAIAGLESAGRKTDDLPRWLDQIRAIGNPDGYFAEGPERSSNAALVAGTVLRAGETLANRDAALAAIKEGQKPDGGWAKGDGPADLVSTYHAMRALFFMKEKPDLDRLRAFVASCRTSEGLYAAAPGGEGTLGSTYQASIITYWSRVLDGQPPVVETAGFEPLFNGRDLDGWEGDPSIWSVRDGAIVGKSGKLDHNVFLATKESYKDFVLSVTFRVVDGLGNSGVQLRSVHVPGGEMSGYQADLGEGYWGSLYDESRRNKTLANASPDALARLRKSDWNHYVIRCFGNHVTIMLNGAVSVDYRETDDAIARDGLIALQVHAGDPMEIQFKDVLIQRVPSPDQAVGDAPGFHVRKVETPQGPRAYTVYVPEGFDRSRTHPAILFLHGAGERGDDGITPSQVGIGPAIVRRGGAAAVVVFPQARKTWQAGSDDADAALKALDDVIKEYDVDPARVTLTGLSMGGMGTWSIAAAHPERFAALVPVCGPGRVEDVGKLKDVPIRAFVGDADSPRLHLGMRAMIEALRAAGAEPGYTEYRSVGHNSWDRAYNDPETIDWMLARKRP